MRGHPVANALDRHLAARDEIAFGEHALDRAVAITVVRIIAHPQRRAVLEDHARGAFDLDHQQIEWILQPADFEFLPIERAGLDRGAIVVGHELVVLVAAADAHAFIWKCNRGWFVAGGEEITRPAVERDMEFGAGKARARYDGLEITGQQSFEFAQPRDANRLKILLEEGARGIRILRAQPYGIAADVPQRSGDLPTIFGAPCLAQRLAARLIGCESREMIIGGPAREFGPFHRLELRACELQRAFRRSAGSPQKPDCPAATRGPPDSAP